MLRRLGFRRVLPLANLALFVILVAAGFYQQRADAEAGQLKLRRTESLGGQVLPPKIDPPATWKTAMVLNVPAFVLGGVVAGTFAKSSSDIYAFVFATPFVPLLWLFIGRWLDYQTRILPPPPKSRLRSAVTVFGVLIALFGFFASWLDYRHGGVSGAMLMTFLWSGLLMLICITALLRRDRLQVKSAAT